MENNTQENPMFDRKTAAALIVETSKKQRYIKLFACAVIFILAFFHNLYLTYASVGAIATLVYFHRQEEMYEKYLIDKYQLRVSRW